MLTFVGLLHSRRTPLLLCTACCLDFNFLYYSLYEYAALIGLHFCMKYLSCMKYKSHTWNYTRLLLFFHGVFIIEIRFREKYTYGPREHIFTRFFFHILHRWISFSDNYDILIKLPYLVDIFTLHFCFIIRIEFNEFAKTVFIISIANAWILFYKMIINIINIQHITN